jgi:quinol monooxygenase YgiN
MIVASIELDPSLEERKAMVEILQFIKRGLRNNPACLSCGLYEGLDEDRKILYLEQWESEQSFHNHIRSTSYLPLLNAMEHVCHERSVCFQVGCRSYRHICNRVV